MTNNVLNYQNKLPFRVLICLWFTGLPPLGWVEEDTLSLASHLLLGWSQALPSGSLVGVLGVDHPPNPFPQANWFPTWNFTASWTWRGSHLLPAQTLLATDSLLLTTHWTAPTHRMPPLLEVPRPLKKDLSNSALPLPTFSTPPCCYVITIYTYYSLRVSSFYQTTRINYHITSVQPPKWLWNLQHLLQPHLLPCLSQSAAPPASTQVFPKVRNRDTSWSPNMMLDS